MGHWRPRPTSLCRVWAWPHPCAWPPHATPPHRAAPSFLRRATLDIFMHVLDMDLTFHLHRKTGELLRIMDRGEGRGVGGPAEGGRMRRPCA